jgi:hypothetical protein
MAHHDHTISSAEGHGHGEGMDKKRIYPISAYRFRVLNSFGFCSPLGNSTQRNVSYHDIHYVDTGQSILYYCVFYALKI